MGTRADFYIGRGKQAEWLGSIAYDGYPDNVLKDGKRLGSATSPEEFKAALANEGAKEDHFTNPEQGWPWPWEDSQTTDYAYAFDEGQVWVSCFGRAWMTVRESLDENREQCAGGKEAVFPDMTDRQKVTYGKRGGILIVGL